MTIIAMGTVASPPAAAAGQAVLGKFPPGGLLRRCCYTSAWLTGSIRSMRGKRLPIDWGSLARELLFDLEAEYGQVCFRDVALKVIAAGPETPEQECSDGPEGDAKRAVGKNIHPAVQENRKYDDSQFKRRIVQQLLGIGRRRLPRHAFAHARFFYQSAEFFNWLFVVVDLQAKHGVVVEPDAAVFLDDDHVGRLHATLVAAGGLAGFQRGQQPKRRWPSVFSKPSTIPFTTSSPARIFPCAVSSCRFCAPPTAHLFRR